MPDILEQVVGKSPIDEISLANILTITWGVGMGYSVATIFSFLGAQPWIDVGVTLASLAGALYLKPPWNVFLAGATGGIPLGRSQDIINSIAAKLVARSRVVAVPPQYTPPMMTQGTYIIT